MTPLGSEGASHVTTTVVLVGMVIKFLGASDTNKGE